MKEYSIPNLKKACEVLKFLSKTAKQQSITDISEALDIPYTSCLRILSTLDQENIVQKMGSHYSLGSALIPLGLKALEEVDIKKIAAPHLEALTQITNETSHISILSGKQALLVGVAQSPQPIRVSLPAGSLVDLHCSGTGKVLLAYAVEDLVSFYKGIKLKKNTQKTLTTIKAITEENKTTRDQAYALDDQEYHEEVRCIAAPLFNAQGQCIAALGITGTTTRFNKKKIPEFLKAIKKTAAAINRQMGFEK